MNYNWNWGVLWEASPEGVGTYFDTLLLGLRWTITTALVAWAIAFVVGSLVGILRTTPNRWVVMAGNAYVELFRNVPILVQLFLWYFVLPEVLPRAAGIWLKTLPNAPFWTACVGIGLFMSARVAEQVKAGIQSLPQGQWMAGTALGFTPFQTYRYVLLPRAYRIIIPPLTSEMLNTVKNTSVALTIGLMELTARTRAMQEFTFQVFEAFTVATILYLAVNILITLIMRQVERHYVVPGQAGSK